MTTGLRRLESSSEHEALQAAVEVARRWIEQQRDSVREKRTTELFAVLVEATAERVAAGVDLPNVRFTAEELFERLAEGMKERPLTAPSRYIRELWNQLNKEIGEPAVFDDIAISLGIACAPGLEKDASPGGRGHPSYYWLAARPVQQEGLPLQVHTEQPVGGIQYRLERIERLPLYSRWIQDIDPLTGGGRLLTALLMGGLLWGLLVFLGVLLLAVGLPWRAIPGLLGTAAVIVGGPWLVLDPLYRVLHLRIIPAPDWWLGLRTKEAQVQYVRTGERRPDGSPRRRLAVVCYGAECPRCGAHVAVVGGGIRWWGRLIGRCAENPREHLYSFDHVTRVGSPLR